jgi:PqqD family protein of HPr-rel-A system
MKSSPTPISMDSRLVANPHMVLREEDDDYALLYDPESGAVRVLNSTAAAIWNLLNGRRTLTEVMAALKKQFENLDSQAEDQLLKLINDLLRAGALGTWEELPK